MEYCNVGSVLDLIKITKKSLCVEEIASVCNGVLKGLEYLHDTKKIHRDIKAGNILLNTLGQCKLADFGVSASLIHTYSRKNTQAGSPYWMSPEVLQKNDYNKKADIWSLGITSIEMAEGNPPNDQMHYVRVMKHIISNPPNGLTQPEKWPPEFNDFVKLCLTVDAKQRPTAKELLLHPFIRKFNKGPGLLSELALKSENAIKEYKESNFQDDSDDNEDNQQNQFFGTGTIRNVNDTVKRPNKRGVSAEEVEIYGFQSYRNDIVSY